MYRFTFPASSHFQRVINTNFCSDQGTYEAVSKLETQILKIKSLSKQSPTDKYYMNKIGNTQVLTWKLFS